MKVQNTFVEYFGVLDETVKNDLAEIRKAQRSAVTIGQS
jgi:hypothetical protein